jgi:hypothetical protein
LRANYKQIADNIEEPFPDIEIEVELNLTQQHAVEEKASKPKTICATNYKCDK